MAYKGSFPQDITLEQSATIRRHQLNYCQYVSKHNTHTFELMYVYVDLQGLFMDDRVADRHANSCFALFGMVLFLRPSFRVGGTYDKHLKIRFRK